MQMMQTGTREYLGKNKFWTPSNIAITHSIVDNSIANINLTDSNSSELFTTNEDKTAIQTKDEIPLEASQFKITPTNEGNSNKFTLKIYYSPATKTNHLGVYQENSSIITFNKDHVQWNVPFGFAWNKGFKFNTNIVGGVGLGAYPSGYLQNLVPSDVTETQMARMTKDAILDNVCPTYKYCDENYAKTADVESNYLTKSYAEIYYAKKQGAQAPYSEYFSITDIGDNNIINSDTVTRVRLRNKPVEISIPSRVGGGMKLVFVEFKIRSDNEKALKALSCTINESNGRTGGDCIIGRITKGVNSRANGQPLSYKFSLFDMFSGKLSKIYLHFYFEEDVKYTDEMKLLTTGTSGIDIRLVDFR